MLVAVKWRWLERAPCRLERPEARQAIATPPVGDRSDMRRGPGTALGSAFRIVSMFLVS